MELESQGVLSKNNWMGTQELLNPLHEDRVGEWIADDEEKVPEETAEAVHKILDVEKTLEINGDNNIEGENVVASKPANRTLLLVTDKPNAQTQTQTLKSRKKE
ncbi:hypothetical protein BDQ17DRAFT_1438450 [Cyathus striatus]|nr:hypothetical protein BDQ17DRAFT_1438450 [Cyathus striatus]